MRRKAWAILSYAANLALILVLLFMRSWDDRLLAGAFLAANLASLFVLLSLERGWDATHYFADALLILSGAFLLVCLALPRLGLTYIYGVVLILASAALIVVELLAGWHSSALARLFERAHRAEPEEEPAVEEVTGRAPEGRFVARKGASIYHRSACATLERIASKDLVELSGGEAAAYGLKPCGFCKPGA